MRLIRSPILEVFNKTLNLSMQTLKRIGDIIPPCFTPLETVKYGEIVLPHLIHIFWWEYYIANNEYLRISRYKFLKQLPEIYSIKCFT